MKTGEVPNQVSRWIKAEIVNLELSRHDFTDVDRILTQYVEYYFHQFELAIEAIGLKYFYLIPENTTVFYKNEAGELISATLRKSVLVGKGMKAVWGKENEMILISDGTEAFYRDGLVSLPFGSSVFLKFAMESAHLTTEVKICGWKKSIKNSALLNVNKYQFGFIKT